jgi:hypothetical protein
MSEARCRCGHGRGHHMVSARNHYSFRRQLVVVLGVSVEPNKVSFECRRCGEVFDQSTDKADLVKGTR